MKSVDKKEYHEDSVTITNDSGKGIKVGKFDVDAKFGWRDITSNVIVRGLGATDPTWAQVGAGPFYAYNFAVNDQCWFAFHIPHDIVPDRPIYFHAHWVADGTDANTVKWEWTFAYAKGFNQEVFDMATGTTVTAEEAAAGIAYRHMVTETAAVTISGLDEPDGIVYVRLRRITNGGTENTDNIYLLTSDIHYQSTNIATKQKAPGFYDD